MRVLLLLLLAAPLAAQSVPEPVDSWEVRFYLAGVDPDVGAPVVTQTFAKAASLCNQAPITLLPGPIINPQQIRLADPDNAGQDCVLGPNADGTLTSLPSGLNQFAVALAHGPTLVSLRSAASNPFDRVYPPGVPLAPGNLRVVP